MAGPNTYSGSNRFDDLDAEVQDARQVAEWLAPDASRTFYAGEPICALPRRRGSTMGGAMLVILVMSACGWLLWKTEAYWSPWANAGIAAVMAEIERSRAGSAPAPAPSANDAGDRQHLLPSSVDIPGKDVADAPGAAAGEAVAIAPIVAPDDATAGPARGDRDGNAAGDPAEEAEVVPLPPARVDPADPYQKRALAAGLHPELSKALLTRMSDEDYRNARIAIAKAIAEVADGGKLVWPKQRTPKLALFHVHFVKGAAADCRRYVVTVTKDGWSTTALPMERCGLTAPLRASAG